MIEMKSKVGNCVNNFIKRIPIIGILSHTESAAKKEAAIEMGTTVMFSTLPIWFGGLIIAINHYFLSIPPDNRCFLNFILTYLQSFYSTISNGELLMYAAASLGPILYLALSTYRQNGKQPWIRLQITIAILTNLLASVLFFLARDKNYAGDLAFVNFTIIIYIFTLTLLFPAMAMDHQRRANPVEIQRAQQEDFVAGYMARKGRS